MSNDSIRYDVVLVGASPANLTLAHRLVDLAKASGRQISIAVLEKAREIGFHILSGAVSNPRVLKKLFPDFEKTEGFPVEGVCNESRFSVLSPNHKWDMPASIEPPEMQKKGYVILSLSNLVRYMAEQLEKKVAAAPNITLDIYPGFGVQGILYEGDKVIGVKVADTGDAASDNVYSKVAVFADKGFVSRDLVKKFNLEVNPQIYSVGVKEIWEIPQSLEGKVWHTLGYPVLDGTFGGGWVYGLKNKRLSIGVVVGLASANPNLRPPELLQQFKKHPWIQSLLKGGKFIKYGAAKVPEGGYFSLPKKFQVDGAMILGDALGTLDVHRFSGVDKAMESGWIAAEVIHDASASGDYSANALAPFQQKVMDSFIGQELKQSRFFRHIFRERKKLLSKHLPRLVNMVEAKQGRVGFGSLLGFGLATLAVDPAMLFQGPKIALEMKGVGSRELRYQRDHLDIVADFQAPTLEEPKSFDPSLLVRLSDAVYTAETQYHEHSKHIDEFNADTCVRCIAKYDGFKRDVPCVADCTAEVHRIDPGDGGKRLHGMSQENCVQCCTCEIVCPEENLRVNAAEQGSGPNFSGM